MIYHKEYIVESLSTTTKQSYYILLSDFQIRQNEAWVITNWQRFAPVLEESGSCWNNKTKKLTEKKRAKTAFQKYDIHKCAKCNMETTDPYKNKWMQFKIINTISEQKWTNN